MYKSSLSLSKKPLQQIRKDFSVYLSSKKYVYCGVLKRKVSLQKQPQALLSCKNQSKRIPYIFIAIDILKKSKNISSRVHNSNIEFEIIGFSKNNDIIKVHIREEIHQKNKVLYLTTCFKKEQKK